MRRMEAGQTQGQGPAPTAGFGRILKNTAFRAIADVGSKVASIALYVVMARRLGDAAFGVFTLGIAFGTLVTSLANMGQQEIVTREVVRDRSRIHAYFANTLALQLTLGLPALLVSLAVGSALG